LSLVFPLDDMLMKDTVKVCTHN